MRHERESHIINEPKSGHLGGGGGGVVIEVLGNG